MPRCCVRTVVASLSFSTRLIPRRVNISTSASHDAIIPPKAGWSRPLTLAVAAAAVAGVAVATTLGDDDDAPPTTTASDPLSCFSAQHLSRNRDHLAHRSDAELLKSWITYRLCEVDWLVDRGPDVLDQLRSACDAVPLVGPVVHAVMKMFVKHTFFWQYTGGETPKECLPLLQDLLERGVGTLFAYSVEGSTNTNARKQSCRVSASHIQATREAISAAATQGIAAVSEGQLKPTSVALKMSGLVTDPSILERASMEMDHARVDPWVVVGDTMLFPHGKSLSAKEAHVMTSLVEELDAVCREAKANGVRIIVDAEYTCFQPAIDRIAQVLASRYNSPAAPPIIYHTIQAYLRSAPERLQACLDGATRFGTGVKLVRGAYLTSEVSRHEQNNQRGLPPTWSTKGETDTCYDQIATRLIHQLANELNSSTSQLGVMIAGHNAESIQQVLRQLRDEEKLAENRGLKLALHDSLRGRLMFAQLFGMGDNLTETLLTVLTPWHGNDYDSDVDLPFVIKYVPFGMIEDVMPYLGRRAQENKTVLGGGGGERGARFERLLVQTEIGERFRRRLTKKWGEGSVSGRRE